MADDNKPLPNIVADANTPPVVLLPGAMAMGGAGAMPQGPPPMGAPGFPMMGAGMPMGPMGPMMPGQMGDFPMQIPIPPGEGCGTQRAGVSAGGTGVHASQRIDCSIAHSILDACAHTCTFSEDLCQRGINTLRFLVVAVGPPFRRLSVLDMRTSALIPHVCIQML